MNKITNYVEGKALEKVVKVCLGLDFGPRPPQPLIRQTNKGKQILIART